MRRGNSGKAFAHVGRSVAIATAAAALMAQAASAATVTMVVSNTNTQDWTRAAGWSDNLAPHSGANYTVGTGFAIRTPASATVTFGGDSLAVTGQIGMQTSGTFTATVNQLSLTGGSTVVSTAGAIAVISGGTLAGTNLNLSGATYVDTSTSNSRRSMTFQYSNVAGSGSLTLDGRGFLTLANTATTYTGNWFVGGANSNSNSQPADLVAQNAGSLGSGSITVNNNGRVDIGYDYASNTSTLSLAAPTTLAAGMINLNHNLSFKAVNIGGTALGQGTYTFAYLNSNYDAYFVDGGSGSITVVPEPIGGAVCATAAAVFGLRRRRSR